MNSTYAQKSSTIQKAADTKAASVLDSSAQNESLQRKADMTNNATQRAEAPRPNNTGMPDNLKSGIESLSGFSMDNVRVHYNSSKPATVPALAYTQGTDIHVAPGQEKHLPHEAWHVAQQMAGRVSPTTNINGMPVNDNVALEHEADVMGEKAVQCMGKENHVLNEHSNQSVVLSNSRVMQQLKYEKGGRCVSIETYGDLKSKMNDDSYKGFFYSGNEEVRYCRQRIKKVFDRYIDNVPDDTFISIYSTLQDLRKFFDEVVRQGDSFVKDGSISNIYESANARQLENLKEFIEKLQDIKEYSDHELGWRLDDQYKDQRNWQIQKNGVSGHSTIACVFLENGLKTKNVNMVNFKKALRNSWLTKCVYRLNDPDKPSKVGKKG